MKNSKGGALGWALAGWTVLAACSGCADDTAAPHSSKRSANTGAAGSKASAAKPAEKYGAPLKVSITVPDVEPGVEGTRCVQVRLGNKAPLNIGRIHNRLRSHSHHFILSLVEDPAATERELFECPPFRAPLTGAPLTITQKADENIQLPDGVGYALGADQLMHLELHYINPDSETTDVTAEAEIYPLAGDEPIQQAGFLVVGNLNIEIPPMSEHSSGEVFAAQPAGLDKAHYYAITGHTHRFGTGIRVGFADTGTADPNWLYEPKPFEWDSPPVEYLDPPMQVPEGGGFRFNCDWKNPTDQTIRYGESALTEMCFFWAYYYPRDPMQKVVLAGIDQSMYAKDAGMAQH
ncbi:MAG TPA: hypothetical protein VJV78_48060 [Polyangiales bacterium]|nr:hypothetical protein [Polyangiales bacterium]